MDFQNNNSVHTPKGLNKYELLPSQALLCAR